MRCLFAALVVALAGCPAPDDPPPVDTPEPTTLGLVLTWSMKAPIPGPLTSEEAVESCDFDTQDLRVVGDAGPGDPRTQAGELDLSWSSGTAPDSVLFPDAPAGLYSQVLLRLDSDDGDDAFEIRGTADVEGTLEPFTIRDTDSLALAMDVSLQLEPDVRGTIAVEIDLHDAIDGISFGDLPTIDGRRVLGPGDAQMSGFRSRLMQAFRAQGSATGAL